MTKSTLGFIGIGRMGIHMAGRLLAAGHPLAVHDINEAAVGELVKRGARQCASPAELASVADTVFVSLPTPDIVRTVALSESGIIAGSKATTFVDLSTTGPRVATEVADGLARKGIVALDAPVSGGPAGAEKGTLAVMVSGPHQHAEQLRFLFEILGRFFWIGEQPGMGQTMKIVNNMLSAGAIALTSEALVMGVKAGLDAETMLDVLNVSSGRNTATEDKFPRCVLPRRFDFGFATELLYKDVKLCLDAAEALGVPMMVGSAVKQLLALTCASQGPNTDITRIVCTVEKWAGAEVKGRS